MNVAEVAFALSPNRRDRPPLEATRESVQKDFTISDRLRASAIGWVYRTESSVDLVRWHTPIGDIQIVAERTESDGSTHGVVRLRPVTGETEAARFVRLLAKASSAKSCWGESLPLHWPSRQRPLAKFSLVFRREVCQDLHSK